MAETIEDRPASRQLGLVIRFDGRELTIDRPIVFGRDSAAALRIDHPLVSRQHLELRPGPAGWLVEDAGSRNGTYLDGRQVKKLVVKEPISLRLGNPERGALLELSPVSQAEDDRTVPVQDPSELSRGWHEADTRLRIRIAGTDRMAEEESVRIGRDARNEIVCADPRVSRFHAVLSFDAEGWHYQDLNSANGSFVDGKQLHFRLIDSPTRIRLGDRIDGVVLDLEPVGAHSDSSSEATAVQQEPPLHALKIMCDGKTTTISGTDPYSIGRDQGCALVVSDRRVSRHHAELRWDGGWYLVDLGSANGIYVRGRQVQTFHIEKPTQAFLADPVDGVSLELVPLVEATARAQARDRRARGDTEKTRDQEDTDLGPLTCTYEAHDKVRIGRGADNEIVLSDLTVSRHHAELVRLPSGDWELVDLQSHNGTHLNGRRIDRAIVSESAVISIGHHSFRLADGQLEEYSEAWQVGLEVRDVRSAVKEQTLLDGVTFSMPFKGLLAAVGPSGAGKSTLLGALLGLRPISGGQVLFGGRDLHACWEEFRQRIGYVPQDDILHPQLSVRRALLFAAELRFPSDTSRIERERRVDEVLSELRLADRSCVRIEKLSGGQRKRVSIALELLTRPTILFLDEPTSGLDPGLEKELMLLFRQLANDGRTVIVVTHAVQSLGVCDRVLFLARGGQTAFFGPPKDALGFFGHEQYADVFLDLIREHDSHGQPRQRDFFQRRFRDDPLHDTYVLQPLSRRYLQREPIDKASAGRPPSPQRGWRQFVTLTRRYFAVIVSDRVNSLLLLMQAPILAVIILLAISPGGFDVRGNNVLQATLEAILFLVVSVTYLGASNAIREIVKELPVYMRERMIGLSIAPYLASKIVLLAVITAFQAAVLVLIGTWRLGGPQRGVVLPDLRLELWAVLFVTGLAAMGLGLFISALVQRADKAVTLLPLLLVPQLVLSFPQLRVEERPVLNQLSYFVSAQWGHAGAASTLDLNQRIYERAAGLDPSLPPGADPNHASGELVQQVQQTTDLRIRTRWRHDPRIWTADILTLVGMLVFELLAADAALRRRDPALLTAPKRKRSPASDAPAKRRPVAA